MQGALFIVLLLAASFVDLKRREIPDWVSGGIASLSLLHIRPECLLGIIPALFFLAAAACHDGNHAGAAAPASVSSVRKMCVAAFKKAGVVFISNGPISGHWICGCLLCLEGVGK